MKAIEDKALKILFRTSSTLRHGGCSRRGAIKVYGIGILYLQKRDLGHEQNTRCVDRAYVCTVCTLHSQSVHTRT